MGLREGRAREHQRRWIRPDDANFSRRSVEIARISSGRRRQLRVAKDSTSRHIEGAGSVVVLQDPEVDARTRAPVDDDPCGTIEEESSNTVSLNAVGDV